MIPAFGFSVGDFIAVIQLGITVAQALSETGGARTRFNETQLQLSALARILNQLESLEATPENAKLFDSINKIAKTCRIQLDSFKNEVVKLDPELTNLVRTSKDIKAKIAVLVSKVKWALKLEKALEKFGAAVSLHLIMINTQLNAGSLERLGQVADDLRENSYITKQILAQVKSISDTVLPSIAANLQRDDDMKHMLENMSTQMKDLSTRDEVNALRPLIDKLSVRVRGQDTMQVEAACLNHEFNNNVIEGFRVQTGILADFQEQIKILISRQEDAEKAGSHSRPVRHGISQGKVETTGGHAGQRKMINRSQQRRLTIARNDFSSTQVAPGMLLSYIGLLLFFVPNFRRMVERVMMGLARPPATSLEDCIQVEDALGRIMNLQYKDFQFWDMLELRILKAFDQGGMPGRFKIHHGEFDVFDLTDGKPQIVTSENYNEIVRPRSKLVVSVLYEFYAAPRQCPSCSTRSTEIGRGNWIKCTFCGLQFLYLDSSIPKTHPQAIENLPADYQSRKVEAMQIARRNDEKEVVRFYKDTLSLKWVHGRSRRPLDEDELGWDIDFFHKMERRFPGTPNWQSRIDEVKSRILQDGITASRMALFRAELIQMFGSAPDLLTEVERPYQFSKWAAMEKELMRLGVPEDEVVESMQDDASESEFTPD